jgi:hypothetical protein
MKPHLQHKRQKNQASVSPNVGTQVVTTGWLLTALTTLLCALTAVLTGWLWDEDPNRPGLGVLVGMLRFASLVASVGAVGLMLAARRMQREDLPRELVAATWAIVAFPWSWMLWRLMS